MKKLTTLILLILISSPTIAQWERSSKVGITGGYEWNVFLNPQTLERNGEFLNRSNLWDNATYQSLFMNNSFKREFANSRIRLDANISGGLYQTNMKANRYSYELGASYRTKYAKRKYFEFAPTLTRIKRDGVNEADAILRTPFSYTQLLIPIHLDFYLGNKAWLKTESGYLYKNYDRQPGQELFYHAPFTNVSISKKWEGKNLVKKLTFRTGIQLRRYTDIDGPIDEEVDDEDNSRSWNYFRNNIEYDITSADKSRSFTFGIYHVKRVDADETNSYSEISPGFRFTRKFGTLRLSGGLKYSVRNYPELTPGEGNDDEPLRYQYLRGNIKATLKMNKSTDLFLKGNLVNRVSSNTDINSIGFRGYFNSVIETGLVIKL